jgi:phosphate transport system substrate-binding protein
VKELLIEQLELIYTGKIRSWKEAGSADALITVYSRENSSGTYKFFKEHVLKGKDFAACVQTMRGTAAVLRVVARDRNRIGYGRAAYGTGAKHLNRMAEDASPTIEPTEENIVGHQYPLWRFLYIYVNPALGKGEITAYLKWIRSPEARSWSRA